MPLQYVLSSSTKRRASALMRDVGADVVFTHAPVDYMADHEETSRIVREAAFASTIPNWVAGTSTPLKAMPAVIYADPIDIMDHFGRRTAARHQPRHKRFRHVHRTHQVYLEDRIEHCKVGIDGGRNAVNAGIGEHEG